MDPKRPSTDTASYGRHLSRWKSLLFTLLAMLIALMVLEGAASLLPLDRLTPSRLNQAARPFVQGTGSSADRYVNSPEFEKYMQPQSFFLNKPAGVKRIFVVGGSAALGWPAEEACSFSGFLRTTLNRLSPGTFEVVNASVMSYGSHRVLDMVSEVVELDPDLVIIWSGNNEYVENNLHLAKTASPAAKTIRRLLDRSHLFQALRIGLFKLAPDLLTPSDETDLTSPRVSRGSLGRLPETDRQVLQNYHANITAIVRQLEHRNIPALICTVPTNLSAWAPDGTRPRFSSPAEAQNWEALMRNGIALLDSGRGEEAAPLFAQAHDIAPGYALSAYFAGMSLKSSGKPGRALPWFEMARDLDLKVLRTPGAFNQSLQRIAANAPSTALVDLEAVFRQASGPELVGLDLFYDYCHPNTAGHKLAAMSVLPILLQTLNGPADHDRLRALSATLTCSGQDSAHQASIAYALGMTYANNGDPGQAESHYRAAIQYAPNFPEALSNLALILMKRNDLNSAEGLLQQALQADPRNIGALYQLGSLYAEQGKLLAAADLLRQALELNANFAEAQETLGDVAYRLGQLDAAEQAYRQALADGGENFMLLLKLGDLLKTRGETELALQYWQRADQIQPNHPESQKRLQTFRH